MTKITESRKQFLSKSFAEPDPDHICRAPLDDFTHRECGVRWADHFGLNHEFIL
jgi:hypothetical protein